MVIPYLETRAKKFSTIGVTASILQAMAAK
jgi:hypothetical protein